MTLHRSECQGWILTPLPPPSTSLPLPRRAQTALLAQAPSATGCGMCKSHVSNPQTVGKCCSLLNSSHPLHPPAFAFPMLPLPLPALSRRLPCPTPAANRKPPDLPEARRLELRLPKNIFTPITPHRRRRSSSRRRPRFFSPLPFPAYSVFLART